MTKLQFRILYREFLFRMVDLEVLSQHALGDSNRLLGQFAALLIFISMLWALAGFGFAGSRMIGGRSLIFTLVMGHFLIATTMLVVGLFAVLSWDSTFPDRRDVLVMAPLPVRARTMFLAKVAAVATALALTVALLHSLAGLIWPAAFAAQATPVEAPALTYDATPVPVTAAGLQSVLDRDLAQPFATGAPKPGTGAGMSVGVYKRGERRVFAYAGLRAPARCSRSARSPRRSLRHCWRGWPPRERCGWTSRFVNSCRRAPCQAARPGNHPARPGDPSLGTPVFPDNVHPADPSNAFADYGASELCAFASTASPNPPTLPSPTAIWASVFGAGIGGSRRHELSGPPARADYCSSGLPDTVVKASAEQQDRLIQGHNANHRPVPHWDLDALAGAGGIRSTAGDLLTWLEANLHPDQSGALDDAIRETHRLRAQVAGDMQIGLVWLYRPNNGTYAHNGRTPGFSTYAFFDPKNDYAAVILLNHGSFLLNSLEMIDEHVRQRLAGEPAISLDTVLVPASSGVGGLVRWCAAYWFTMLAAGGFLYARCCFSGLAAQLLPRRWFLRVSGYLQLASFCLIVCVYFLQPVFGEMSDLNSRLRYAAASLATPYWFLGLFHQLNGSMYAARRARRAWMGLGIVIAGTGVTYALSYLRTLRRSWRSRISRPTPAAPVAAALRDRLQTAVGQFGVRALVRSRQHRMILAFYFESARLTIFQLRAPELKSPLPESVARSVEVGEHPLLAASIALMTLSIVARAWFAMPLDSRQLIFRVTGVRGSSKMLAATRRSLWVFRPPRLAGDRGLLPALASGDRPPAT